jgi:hypothetical protein
MPFFRFVAHEGRAVRFGAGLGVHLKIKKSVAPHPSTGFARSLKRIRLSNYMAGYVAGFGG